MKKRVTATVSRLVQDKRTRKVRAPSPPPHIRADAPQTMTRSHKFLAHDTENALRKGEVVVIRQCAPLSKRKANALDRVFRVLRARSRSRQGARGRPRCGRCRVGGTRGGEEARGGGACDAEPRRVGTRASRAGAEGARRSGARAAGEPRAQVGYAYQR
jgi:ribosomal protein S17